MRKLEEIERDYETANPKEDCSDEGCVCGICGNQVLLHDYADPDTWNEDPICDPCFREIAIKFREDIPALVACVRELAEALKEQYGAPDHATLVKWGLE